MLVIKNGRELKPAWRIYVCDYCGQYEAECKRKGQASGPSYSNDILEAFADPYVDRDKVAHYCSNCGRKMRQVELTRKEYVDLLLGKEIPLCDHSFKTLEENDLFYCD